MNKKKKAKKKNRNPSPRRIVRTIPTGGAWDEFKIVDGVKLYKCDCSACGKEFYSKNPYGSRCGDKAGHAEIRKKRAAFMAGLTTGRVPRRGPTDEWSGAWDNAVSNCER